MCGGMVVSDGNLTVDNSDSSPCRYGACGKRYPRRCGLRRGSRLAFGMDLVQGRTAKVGCANESLDSAQQKQSLHQMLDA